MDCGHHNAFCTILASQIYIRGRGKANLDKVGILEQQQQQKNVGNPGERRAVGSEKAGIK